MVEKQKREKPNRDKNRHKSLVLAAADVLTLFKLSLTPVFLMNQLCTVTCDVTLVVCVSIVYVLDP